MNAPARVHSLLESLSREAVLLQHDKEPNPLPILDLLGNLRDEAGSYPAGRNLRERAAEAWERLVKIVESAQAFTLSEIEWFLQAINQLRKDAQLDQGTEAQAIAMAVPEIVPEPVSPLPDPLPGEIAVELDLERDQELLGEFVTESREHLDHIEQGVLVLEKHPTDADTLSMVFRAFHTFKGSAGFLNLIPINQLAHSLESLLDLARQAKLEIDRPIIELILRGRDVLRSFVDAIADQVNGKTPRAPIQIGTVELKAQVLDTVARVTGAANRVRQPGIAAPPAPRPQPPFAFDPQQPEPGSASSKVTRGPETGAASEAGASANVNSTVKVDTAKLDALLDLVGEMVIAQSLVAPALNELARTNSEFERNRTQLTRTTKELQRVSMSLRMIPIRGLFNKMTRVVRDLSAKQQKPVQLVTVGQDTELDRGMVDDLSDPLLHMIRNAVDHGVETPEIRARNGKPEIATLFLRAYHQGGNIVLEIEDDGAGLDRARILAKAEAKGLVNPGRSPSEDEILGFIFAPGFSTVDRVTDVSGRGVGMDVVKRSIEKMRGRIDIVSTPGKGTLFRLYLPLTLAIIDALIVKVGKERFILPTLSVRESFCPLPQMISKVQGVAELINVRGRLIPLLRLYEHFGVTPDTKDALKSIVVVVQSGSDLRCLLVDSLVNKQEVVIKSLNEVLVRKSAALAGAAILGDGRVGLILDVNSLVHLGSNSLS
jgi:two-component system, chemotaxis family, sensor kinase CheA